LKGWVCYIWCGEDVGCEPLRHIRYKHPNLSSVASHALKHINQPNTQHASNIDNISLFKDVRKPNPLDAYESIFIRKRKMENIELLNEDDGNVKSRGAAFFDFETLVWNWASLKMVA
jgi:hypothetical protein